MSKQETLFLSLEDVVAAGGTDMKATINDVELGFQLLREEKITAPHKLTLSSSNDSANGFNILPAIVNVNDEELFGAKILGANPENLSRNLPRAMGLIALYDGDSKVPLSVMDMQVISAMRTGAVSGLAARKLVDSETESVGLIGAGVNMRTQLVGIQKELPKLRRVMVHALNGSKYKFAQDMGSRTGLYITPHETGREVIESNEFNILCTTKPKRPIIEQEWLHETGNTVFNISGVATPIEALPDMDRLVTDSWEDCKHRGTQSLPAAVEAGILNESRVENLSQILADDNGRHNKDENIFFCPVGLAFEDVLVANRIYKTALAKKIGQRVTLWNDTNWI